MPLSVLVGLLLLVLAPHVWHVQGQCVAATVACSTPSVTCCGGFVLPQQQWTAQLDQSQYPLVKV